MEMWFAQRAKDRVVIAVFDFLTSPYRLAALPLSIVSCTLPFSFIYNHPLLRSSIKILNRISPHTASYETLRVVGRVTMVGGG